MKFKEIQELIRMANRLKLHELKIEQKDFKIHVKTKHDNTQQVVQTSPASMTATPQPAAPAQQPQPSEPSHGAEPKQADAQDTGGDKPTDTPADDEHLLAIKSPMIGTFYRRPDPEKPAFVKVGDTVNEGDVVCIIEAMKLFNEIESEVSGKVVKILMDDASPVEYDQPLILVEPN